MNRILAGAVVTIAAAALPSVAHGATLYTDGRTPHRLLLQADTGETNLVTVEGSRGLVIRDDGAPIKLARVPTCMPIDAFSVRCSAVRRLELDLGDGPDVAVVATRKAVAIDGGGGRDRYVALAGDAPSRVDFDGGIGLDTANYFYATAGVDVAVDLEAGDGRPGDNDRIRTNVEAVIGSQFDDVLVGGRHTLDLSGMDGDDHVTGGSGEELLSGGPGNDRIDARDGARDTVNCGGQLLDWAAVDVGAEAAVAGCAVVA